MYHVNCGDAFHLLAHFILPTQGAKCHGKAKWSGLYKTLNDYANRIANRKQKSRGGNENGKLPLQMPDSNLCS